MIEARDKSILDRYFNGAKPAEREFAYRPPVALVGDNPNLDLYLKAYDMKKFKAKGIPGFVVCPASYQVLIPPEPHNNGSHAEYYIDGQITTDGDALFVYTLSANKETSRHTHEDPLSEDYFLLRGKALMDGQVMSRYMYAPSDTDHHVTAKSPRILVMAVLRNAGSVPREEWHKHIEKAA